MQITTEQNIAEQLFIAMQFSDKKEHLDRTILSIARMYPTLNTLEYTEFYFYEEIVFVNFLALEAEASFGFIQYLIDGYERELGLPHVISPPAICGAMRQVSYPLACDRMRLAGIEPTPVDQAQALDAKLASRFSEYQVLVKSHLACGTPVPERPWSAGLTHREHPFEKYMGAVSDNICAALNQPLEAVDQAAVEMAVMQKWQVAMTVAQEAQSLTG